MYDQSFSDPFPLTLFYIDYHFLASLSTESIVAIAFGVCATILSVLALIIPRYRRRIQGTSPVSKYLDTSYLRFSFMFTFSSKRPATNRGIHRSPIHRPRLRAPGTSYHSHTNLNPTKQHNCRSPTGRHRSKQRYRRLTTYSPHERARNTVAPLRTFGAMTLRILPIVGVPSDANFVKSQKRCRTLCNCQRNVQSA